MPRYTYVVKDQEGKTYKSTASFATKDALINHLQKKDLFVVSIVEGSEKSTVAKKSSKKIKKVFRRKKIQLQDLLVFSRQLATMLEAGVPLVRSIAVIQTQIESEKFYHVVEAIRKEVEQGGALSAALANHPTVFNQFWISLVEVGEASGTIHLILNKLAFYLEQQAEFRTTIISGIIYPAILFAVSMAAVAFFALIVGPKFENIFESMGIELPLITKLLLSIFHFLRVNALYIIGSIVVSIFILREFKRTHQGKSMFERFMFNLPVLGGVYKTVIIERFSAQMAILIESGVPILYALEITERLVDNNTCAHVIANTREAVQQGELLVAPMERSGFFPPMCVQMITVGEETGELGKMLNHVAQYYQSNVETFMKRFATIVEPFMLVFMGVIIGTIVVAMFLPMFNLSQLGGLA